MTHAFALPVPSAAGSLDPYVQTVNRFPILTPEEEMRLWPQLARRGGSRRSARQLVLSHLRVVVAIARGYLGYGLPQADLIQEGNIGLMKAVKRFDPERGVRLVSFAVHWIRAEMHEFILRNWRIVKVATTKAQRKLFFNLRSMKRGLGALGVGRAECDRQTAQRQARGSRRNGDAPGRARTSRSSRRRGRRRGSLRADRLPRADPTREPARSWRKRKTERLRSAGLTAGARVARPAQPPHHRSALAAREGPGDAARSRRRVRGIGRAHPADRGEGAAKMQGRDRRRRRLIGPRRQLQPTPRRRRGVLFYRAVQLQRLDRRKQQRMSCASASAPLCRTARKAAAALRVEDIRPAEWSHV